ncbi:MAG TPA: tetratricopeptide repeat protein [Anaerolineae bacterium]|nr:tetratricopeptide repeat protein [Anaerolineae bacterium]
MGQRLVENMLPALNKMQWPKTPAATELGRQTFEIGLDKADDYANEAKVLAAALRTFQTGDSRPYAFAGVAYTLIKASRESDESYSQAGLAEALGWLEKAQELDPDVLEINVVEALIYIYGGRFDDARLVLDYLEAIDDHNYYVHRAEIAYWQEQGELDETVRWYEQTINAAETVPRKLRLRRDLGDCYLRFKRFDKAVQVYNEAIHFAKENPRLWHNMSVAYWQLDNYEEAARCNQQAIKLQSDFPEARKMEDALKEKMDTGGLGRRLFGR